MNTISIHQPNFLPWIGFFNKIVKSDVFIILDDVKCSKGSFFNRNRFSIKKNSDWFWLSVPIEKSNFHLNINDVYVDSKFINDHNKHFELFHLKNSKEPDLIKQLIEIYKKYNKNEKFKLIDFNIDAINLILRSIDCKTSIVKSSDIIKNNNFKKQDLIIEIIKKVKGTHYLSGMGAKSYQDINLFIKNGINLKYNEFIYDENFLIKNEHMSVFDFFLKENICQLKKNLFLH